VANAATKAAVDVVVVAEVAVAIAMIAAVLAPRARRVAVRFNRAT